jgi:hypothetical protein
MNDETMAKRFPEGLRMLRARLERERIRFDMVNVKLHYYSWSWSLEVTCPSISYKFMQQLPPEDLKADTSFAEICERIAEELGDRLRMSSGTS